MARMGGGWGANSPISGSLVFIIGVIAVMAYLVLLPLGMAIFTSFKGGGALPFEAGPLTAANYVKVFLDPATWGVMRNTILYAGGSMVIALTLATAFSWLLERSDIQYQNLMFALVIAPLAMPGMLVAISWIFLLEPSIGAVNIVLRFLLNMQGNQGPLNIYTLGGMVFVDGVRTVPSIFLLISAAFRNMDPALEEASRMAGKSNLATIFRVTLPMMRPAILAAAIYYLIVAMEAFEVPGVLGLNAGIHLLSTRIYWVSNPPGGGLPNYGLASCLGVITIVIGVLMIYLYNRLTRGGVKNFATITGKGFRPERIHLGKWRKLAIWFCALYFLVALVLPVMILAWASLLPYYRPPSLAALASITLESYRSLWQFPNLMRALGNTVTLMLITATAGMVLAALVAWVVVRSRFQPKVKHIVDTMSFLPQAVPSIVVALAVLLLYVSFPNPFYGTILILAIVLITRYLAYGSRIMNAGFLQIHSELEEASQVVGASWWKTWFRVLIPLAAPALINGWIWMAVHSTRELSAALMFYTPGTAVMSTQIWTMWENNRTAEAGALGVVLIVLLFLFNWLGRSLLLRIGRSF